MNKHQTTEDPKNIRMTEQERSTLHTRIMQHIGTPNTHASPVKVHPSQWFSAAAFKPVFLALFLLMISTSGVLLYQERAIKETKEGIVPVEEQATETVDTKIAPANTTVQQKTFQTLQLDTTVAPMMMKASSTQVEQPAVASQKRVTDTRPTGTISGHIKRVNPMCWITDRSTSDPECENTKVQINIVVINKDTSEQYTLHATNQGEIQDTLPLGTYLVEPENKEDGTLKPNEYTVSENSPYQVFTLYK